MQFAPIREQPLGVPTPGERDVLEAGFRGEKERLSSERDAKVETVRNGQ